MTFARITTGTPLAAAALLFSREGLVLAQALPAQNAPPLAPVQKMHGTPSPASARSIQLPMAFEAMRDQKEHKDDFLA